MTCIAVDDEPKALDILTLFIARIPFLDLLGTFRDPFEALNYTAENKPDLIFLDISMPEMTGLQLLRSLPNPPLVILTTAYSEHALDGYELNVIDYLLKPFEFERFLKAVMKAKELATLKAGLVFKEMNSGGKEDHVVFIKSGTKIHRIKIDTIRYIEGLGNYVTFFLPDKKIVSYLSINDVLNMLPPDQFCRIHKSYVVSLRHIDIIEKHQVIVDNKPIPVGLTYREKFARIMGKK